MQITLLEQAPPERIRFEGKARTENGLGFSCLLLCLEFFPAQPLGLSYAFASLG